MSEYLIQSETLTQIADAIRSKTGSAEAICVGDMAGAIEDIIISSVEEAIIDLNFSGGAMVLEPKENTLFSKIVIQKPGALIPENVAEGVDISGVIGTLKGGGGFELDGFAKYLIYQIDEENKEITIYGILWSQLKADTGSYDVEIPSHYGEYQVVVNAGGVV